MTNNTQHAEATARTLITLQAMKVAELRKYARQNGIKNVDGVSVSNVKRDTLTTALLNVLVPEPAADEKKTERVRTSHADCKHASTKVARAKCRRERARKNV